MYMRFEGPIWEVGYKTEQKMVIIGDKEFYAKSPCTSGQVWSLFEHGEHISDYQAPEMLLRVYKGESNFTDVDNVVYSGPDRGDMLLCVPDMRGLSGIKVIGEESRVVTRISDKQEAYVLYGKLCCGGDFVHKYNPNLLHYAKDMRYAMQNDWLCWSDARKRFFPVVGGTATVVFEISELGVVTSDYGSRIVPVGIEPGKWKVVLPEAGIDVPIYVTKKDVEMANEVPYSSTPYCGVAEDTQAAISDRYAWNDIVNMVSAIQEIMPDEKKNKDEYALQNTLSYMLELLADEEG